MPTTSVNLTVTAPTLPAGACYPATYQELLNDLASKLQVDMTSQLTPILCQIATPTASERDLVWLKLNGDGSPQRVYKYFNGAWVARHMFAPGSPVRMVYTSSLLALESFDGGASGAVGDAAGPMWEEDTNYQGKFVVGPDGTVAVGDTGGSASNTLTEAQLPKHNHKLLAEDWNQAWTEPPSSVQTILDRVGGVGSDQYVLVGASASRETAPATRGSSSDVGEGTSVENRPPYRAAYVIKRTNRIFYTG